MKIAFLLFTCFLAINAADKHAPEQVHISLGDNESQMIITWSTRSKTENCQVKYGKSEDDLSDTVDATRKKLDNDGHSQHIYHALLKGLSPKTTYYYQVGSGDASWSKTFNFKTFSVQHGPITFAIYGDLGVKGNSTPSLLKGAKEGKFDMVLHVGDFAYDLDKHHGKVGDQFLKEIEPMASKIPYMTAIGDHELDHDSEGVNYDLRFNMPGGNSRRHTFTIGPVRVISFSTEEYTDWEGGSIKRAKEQKEWLTKILSEANKTENRKKQPWIIAMGHKAMYCSCKEEGHCDGGVKDEIRTGLDGYPGLEDVFHKYGVDLYFSGHEHHYERNLPVYKKQLKLGKDHKHPYHNHQATIYVITGAAGMEDYLYEFEKKHPKWSAYRASKYGYTLLTIHNSTSATMKQLDVKKHDHVIDSIDIVQEHHGPFK